MPHIAAAYRQAEFLEAADWTWLRGQLSHHPFEQVYLVTPPMTGTPEPPVEPNEVMASAPGPASKLAIEANDDSIDPPDPPIEPAEAIARAPDPAIELNSATPEDRARENLGPVLGGRYMFRLSWDGSLRIHAILASSCYDFPQESSDADQCHDYTRPGAVLEGVRSGLWLIGINRALRTAFTLVRTPLSQSSLSRYGKERQNAQLCTGMLQSYNEVGKLYHRRANISGNQNQ